MRTSRPTTSSTPTTPRVIRPSLFLAAAIAALGGLALLMPSRALAAGATHTTLADFQQNVRADVLLEPFNGAAGPNPPIVVSGNGYAYSVSQTTSALIVRNTTFGVGAQGSNAATRFTFTGKPATAFGGTFRRMDSNSVSIGGTISVLTDTGESFTVTAAVGGTFFGFTVTQPFSTVTLDTTVPGQGFEYIDDVYVGTSGTAAAASDQCADASTITPTSAAVYPFTTVGATAEAIPGVCDGAVDTGPDVWFRYVAPMGGTVVFNTCGCTFDSILRVFASCAASTLGANIACNDDFCLASTGLNRASQVSFRVVAGEDYLVRISGYNGESGSGNLNFSFSPDCAADFNHNGGKEVQDIFDFLASWFGAC